MEYFQESTGYPALNPAHEIMLIIMLQGKLFSNDQFQYKIPNLYRILTCHIVLLYFPNNGGCGIRLEVSNWQDAGDAFDIVWWFNNQQQGTMVT